MRKNLNQPNRFVIVFSIYSWAFSCFSVRHREHQELHITHSTTHNIYSVDGKFHLISTRLMAVIEILRGSTSTHTRAHVSVVTRHQINSDYFHLKTEPNHMRKWFLNVECVEWASGYHRLHCGWWMMPAISHFTTSTLWIFVCVDVSACKNTIYFWCEIILMCVGCVWVCLANCGLLVCV